MHVWDYDLKTLGTDEAAERWQLERLVLYGLGGRKIPRHLLKKHMKHLRLPEEHAYFLKLILA